MADRPRFTGAVCEHAEGMQDFWKTAWADGEISAAEGSQMTLVVAEHVSIDADTDEQVAMVLTQLKCGVDSPRAARQRRERAQRLGRRDPGCRGRSGGVRVGLGAGGDGGTPLAIA